MNSRLGYIIITWLFFGILVGACRKETSSFTEVSGTVYEYGTKDPIPYAKVRFEWWDPAVFGEERYHVDSTTANAQGYYELAGDIPELQEYYVIPEAPSYYERERTPDFGVNVKRGQKQIVNLNLIPYAWVRMHVTKTGKYVNLSINPPVGHPHYSGYFFYSDSILISKRVWGNWDVKFSLFKAQNASDPPDREQVIVPTIGHDTVDAYFSY